MIQQYNIHLIVVDCLIILNVLTTKTCQHILIIFIVGHSTTVELVSTTCVCNDCRKKYLIH